MHQEDFKYFIDNYSNDHIISYETAVLAREKGFKVIQTYCYDPKCLDVNHIYDWCSEYSCSTDGRIDRLVSAPTQAGLQRWIREVHKIHIEIYSNATGWGWILTKINGAGIKEITDDIFFKSYEEALEVGLRETLNQL